MVADSRNWAEGNDFQLYIIEHWKRYLDDCFILWNRSLTDLHTFKTIINGINQDIQFTMEYSTKELPFLDLLVMKVGSNLETDIYYKPTDSKQYLLFSSCHPKHTRLNIPLNLAKRICTIVNNKTTRNKRLEELRIFLEQRKYPKSLIQNGINMAKEIDIKELRKVKTKEEKTVIPYVSTFNPQNNEIYNIIHGNIPILTNDERMKNVLNNKIIIKSKRQPKSLKKLLTKAKLPAEEEENQTITKCGRSNCGNCLYMIEGSTFKFKNGMVFKVKHSMSCASSNLIYVITCQGCQEQYIGQTSLTIRKRMTLHRQQIRDPSTRMIPLSGHIDSCAKNCEPKFLIFPIYQFKYQTTQQQREIKETLFIKKYKPSLNV